MASPGNRHRRQLYRRTFVPYVQAYHITPPLAL